MVRAVIPSGKYAGVHEGRITIRARPNFRLKGMDVHPKHLRKLICQDGYEYTPAAAAVAIWHGQMFARPGSTQRSVADSI